MHLRPATARDLDALLAFPLDPALGGVEPNRLREELDAGRMRWPWTWLAFDDDGALVGRALWWGRTDSTTPLTLDCLHVLDRVLDRAGLGGSALFASRFRECREAAATGPPLLRHRPRAVCRRCGGGTAAGVRTLPAPAPA